MKRILIIGNCAAGLSALENFRMHDRESEVLIISKEGTSPYSRVLLPYILRKKISYENLKYREEDYYAKLNAKCICDEVVDVDENNKIVITKKGDKYQYDKLFIASGSYAVKPPIDGINLKGIYNMWTRDDLDKLIPLFDDKKSVCVLGSGFVALQAAWAARYRGLDVTVIELMDRIMPTVLDKKGSEILTNKIKEKGVKLLTNTSTKSFEKMDDGTFKVHIAGMDDIYADFVIVGTGVRSNIQFISNTSIKCDRGICVDDHMMTNVVDIYAGGDVAAGPTIFGDEHMNHALWPTAIEMGKIAGENMAGLDTKYRGSLNMNVTEMYDVTVASIGKFNDSEVDESFVLDDDLGLGYIKLCFKNNRFIGGCLVGDSEAVEYFGIMRQLIIKKKEKNCEREEILNYLRKEAYKLAAYGEVE